jgi:acetyl-CoA carboxylase carboxyl transferase subunit alpha
LATKATSSAYLPFEEPILVLDQKIRELEELSRVNKMDFSEEIRSFRKRREEVIREIYGQLSAWERVQIARHEGRPQARDYVDMVFTEFVELSGDRMFADDLAVVCGFGRIGEQRVMLVGQHKGRNVRERHVTNAGSPHPEGYRKALQKMMVAERFSLPVVCLIDTKGAFPGTGAEERGQAIAIAENLLEMSRLRVPVLAAVIGEGGSGGALGIGVADRLLMLEYSYYSVISPEGCAAILWKSASKAADAAASLRLTPAELAEMGICDEIVPEPLGGAHQDPKAAGELLRSALLRNLEELRGKGAEELLAERYARLRRIGVVREGQASESDAGGSAEAAALEG